MFEPKPGDPMPVGSMEPNEFLRELEPLIISCIRSLVPHAEVLKMVMKIALIGCLRDEGFVIDKRSLSDLPTALYDKIKTCAETELDNIKKREGPILSKDYARVNRLIITKCIQPIIDCMDTANTEAYQSMIAAAPQRT